MIPVGIVGLFLKDYVESFFWQRFVIGRHHVAGNCGVVDIRLLCPASGERRYILSRCIHHRSLAGGSRFTRTFAFRYDYCDRTHAGKQKEQVARFSFLMVIIPILGEALLDLMKGGFSPAESGLSVSVMIIGFLAAFVSGCLACKWMLRLVNNGKLVYFAIYCVAMGACAIIYSLVH